MRKGQLRLELGWREGESGEVGNYMSLGSVLDDARKSGFVFAAVGESTLDERSHEQSSVSSVQRSGEVLNSFEQMSGEYFRKLQISDYENLK